MIRHVMLPSIYTCITMYCHVLSINMYISRRFLNIIEIHGKGYGFIRTCSLQSRKGRLFLDTSWHKDRTPIHGHGTQQEELRSYTKLRKNDHSLDPWRIFNLSDFSLLEQLGCLLRAEATTDLTLGLMKKPSRTSPKKQVDQLVSPIFGSVKLFLFCCVSLIFWITCMLSTCFGSFLFSIYCCCLFLLVNYIYVYLKPTYIKPIKTKPFVG